MPFAQLYEAVQKQEGRIGTGWLRDQAIHLTAITAVKEQWSGVLDGTIIRGFYIEGPMGPPVTLTENEALIVLARSMCSGPLGAHWRRFVFTKELMHVFDEEHEKAGTPETFDKQIQKFGDPKAEMSPQFRAEGKAFWRALAVLCPEKDRLAYKGQVATSALSIDVMASALHLPAIYAAEMLRDDFEQIVQHLLEG